MTVEISDIEFDKGTPPLALLALADLVALARPAYKSKAELTYASIASVAMLHLFGESAVLVLYEPLTFNLPGGSYTPDFMQILESGRIVFTEIKGSVKQKNARDSISKLRAAAAVYPFFSFVLAEKDDSQIGFGFRMINDSRSAGHV